MKNININVEELVLDLVIVNFSRNQANWLVENNIELAIRLVSDDVTDEEIEEAESILASNNIPHEYASDEEIEEYEAMMAEFDRIFK